LQFNQATDYAFRTMLHMAGLPPGTVVNTQELAEQQSIPPRFLLKVMRSLRHAGLIRSHRGVEGGFSLARPAGEVSLLDIVEAMEGRLGIHRCLAEREACNKHCTDECPVHATLARLQAELLAGLRQANLASLAAEKGANR
jgi:Rrf2 family protein